MTNRSGYSGTQSGYVEYVAPILDGAAISFDTPVAQGNYSEGGPLPWYLLTRKFDETGDTYDPAQVGDYMRRELADRRADVPLFESDFPRDVRQHSQSRISLRTNGTRNGSDIYDVLRPETCIGMNLEPDTRRPGEQVPQWRVAQGMAHRARAYLRPTSCNPSDMMNATVGDNDSEVTGQRRLIAARERARQWRLFGRSIENNRQRMPSRMIALGPQQEMVCAESGPRDAASMVAGRRAQMRSDWSARDITRTNASGRVINDVALAAARAAMDGISDIARASAPPDVRAKHGAVPLDGRDAYDMMTIDAARAAEMTSATTGAMHRQFGIARDAAAQVAMHHTDRDGMSAMDARWDSVRMRDTRVAFNHGADERALVREVRADGDDEARTPILADVSQQFHFNRMARAAQLADVTRTAAIASARDMESTREYMGRGTSTIHMRDRGDASRVAVAMSSREGLTALDGVAQAARVGANISQLNRAAAVTQFGREGDGVTLAIQSARDGARTRAFVGARGVPRDTVRARVGASRSDHAVVRPLTDRGADRVRCAQGMCDLSRQQMKSRTLAERAIADGDISRRQEDVRATRSVRVGRNVRTVSHARGDDDSVAHQNLRDE